MNRILLILLCSVLWLFKAQADVAWNDSTAVVSDDGSVTLRCYAPDAKRVWLEGSVLPKKQKMHRNGDYWTYRLDSLPSELYTYRFLTGKHTSIPEKTGKGVMRDVEKYYHYFIVPGDTTQYFFDREVPHGCLEYVWYPSTLNGMSQRRMAVYLPHGYEDGNIVAECDTTTKKANRYPVLYLLHGSGGDETAWADAGRACQIFDNMIADGRIKPMIVVMPNGNVELDAAPGESPWMDKEPSSNNIASMTGKVELAFAKEVVGYVDKHYRTLTDKSQRAIAGLSLGGLHTIYISANNPDMFDYVGLFSAQATNMLDDRKLLMISRAQRNLKRVKQAWGIIFNFMPSESIYDEKLSDVMAYGDFESKLARQFQNPPKVYYIAIGDQDLLLLFNKKLMEKLDAGGYKYEFHLTPGAHSWDNWRHYLVDFLPKLNF